MMRGCVVLFLSIHLLEQIQILDAFILSCNASLQTVTRVAMCPSNIPAYEEAVQKKNCSSLAPDAQTCQSFQYHCVLSDDLNYAIEVCAPSIYIIGYVCTKFSTIQKSIMRIDGFACNDSFTECPFGYNSTESFKYLPCYANVDKLLSTELPPRREIIKSPSLLSIVLAIISIILVIGIISFLLYTFVYKRRTFIRRQRVQLNVPPEEFELDNRAQPNVPPEDLELENRVPAQNSTGLGQVLLGENQDDIDGDHNNGEARSLLEDLHNQLNEVLAQESTGPGQVLLGENQDDIDGDHDNGEARSLLEDLHDQLIKDESSKTNERPLSSNTQHLQAQLPIATSTEHLTDNKNGSPQWSENRQNQSNNGILISGEQTSDPSIPEEQNAPKTDANINEKTQLLIEEHAKDGGSEYTDANINEKTQPLIEERAKDGGSEYTEHSEENTDSLRLPESIKQITPGREQAEQNTNSPRCIQCIQQINRGHDSEWVAVLKTKISTTQMANKFFLKTEINYLLQSLRNPTESWTKDDLVKNVEERLNKLYEREAFDLLADFCTAITEDKNINNTLRICQKEICQMLNSLEKKYHAKINVSNGCVCFTFYFDTDNDLQSFLVKVQEGQEELRKDISEFFLNKTLMDVFRVDSMCVSLVISKVSANKGSLLVYQKDFLKSTIAEDDMTAEGNIEDGILKKNLPESQKIELESKFDSVLSSMKNPESKQETDFNTLVEEIIYEVIANKRIDLLTQIATAYEEEAQNALHKHGANMHSILIPIFEDVNLILNIFRKGHLMITEKDIEAYDEAVANRFRTSQKSKYIGYKFCNTRALSFSAATKWMKSRKREFAKFGFFYKGTDLSAICFHCGCLKDGWTEEDDILATHLSLTESCEYANYMISALPLPF